jgi:hypothetical protein
MGKDLPIATTEASPPTASRGYGQLRDRPDVTPPHVTRSQPACA